MRSYRKELVLPGEVDVNDGYSTGLAFKTESLRVQIGASTRCDRPRRPSVSVEFENAGLRFLGGEGLHKVVQTILDRHLTKKDTETALTEAVMQYAGNALGWCAILDEFTAICKQEADFAHDAGHRDAREELIRWLSGGRAPLGSG